MFAIRVAGYLWDLEQAGVEAALDLLQGQLGVGGLTVVAGVGPVCQLRRRRELEPRVFRTRGGICFQPDDALYQRTRVKPIVEEHLKTRNPLAKIAEACEQRGLELRVRLETRRIGRMAGRYPEAAVKSAFGDVSPDCLCLSNPDAAEWLRAVMVDLSRNYGVAAIELVGLDRAFDLFEGVDGPAGLPNVVRELLAVCFCESCMQAAGGVDATSAALRSAQVTLSGLIEGRVAATDSLDALLADDDVLLGYVNDRRQSFDGFVDSLAGGVDCELVLHCDVDGAVRCPDGFAGVQVDASSAGEMDRVHAVGDGLSGARMEALVDAWDPTATDGAVLVKRLHDLVDLGVSGITLWHYGSMGDAEQNAARQAIRYATRSAEL